MGNVLFRLHYIEMFGTGMRRIMQEYRGSARQPSFEVTENSVCVILPAYTNSFETTSDGKSVLDALAGGTILSSREVAERLSWSKDKSIRVLNELIASGYIRVVGSGRGTKYAMRQGNDV